MNFLKKLTIPFLLLILISLMYTFYFSDKGLGSFATFDTNNNANKEIRVKIVQEKGFKFDDQNSILTFYAADKSGVQYPVQAPITENLQSVQEVILTGHLHTDHFHATGIEID
jgi:hypothetical protein